MRWGCFTRGRDLVLSRYIYLRAASVRFLWNIVLALLQCKDGERLVTLSCTRVSHSQLLLAFLFPRSGNCFCSFDWKYSTDFIFLVGILSETKWRSTLSAIFYQRLYFWGNLLTCDRIYPYCKEPISERYGT